MAHCRVRQYVGRIGLAAIVLASAGSCRRASEQPGAGASPATAPAAAPPSAGGSPPVTAEAIEDSLLAADQYFNAGELDKAQAILETLVIRAPGDVRARELLGQTLIRKAVEADTQLKFDDAAAFRDRAWEQYKAAVAIEPDSPGLRHSAAMIAHQAGHYDEALANFQVAASLDPLNPQPALYAAQLLLAKDRIVEAEAELKRAQKLDPDLPLVYASLAVIAMRRADVESARQLIAQARTLDPYDLGLLAQEAGIHRIDGNARRSLEMLLLLDEPSRANELVAAEIAGSYLAIGEPLKAAQVWVHRIRFLRSYPTRWRDAARAADAYLAAGDRQSASLWLQEASLVAPDAEEVKAVETKLARPAGDEPPPGGSDEPGAPPDGQG
jgi:Flp pilus assembly protein TadD